MHECCKGNKEWHCLKPKSVIDYRFDPGLLFFLTA